MDIYIIRHADALALGERGVTADEDRPLSERGEAQSRTVGAALLRHGITLDKVITSPYLRARQTAEEMLRSWPPPLPEVHVCADLVPDGKPKKLARFLRGLGSSNVALVGHQPHLGIWTGWIIGSKNANIDLAKAGIVHVTCDKPKKGLGILHWMVDPEWFEDGGK
ncbi:MAG TPA: phosphohistidine phosphatase SixA [Gemmataceae bacterium]|nr:phosphohistidine phosphatase SixA [Gemmataceae bacterium]